MAGYGYLIELRMWVLKVASIVQTITEGGNSTADFVRKFISETVIE